MGLSGAAIVGPPAGPGSLVEPVLSCLHQVRQTGDGRWRALCPAHDDHDPSLDVRIGSTGCVLLKCWAGCKVASVVGAMGLRMADLFPRALSAQRSSPPRRLAPAQSPADLEIESRRFAEAISPAQVESLAFELGVRPDTLQALDIGWADRSDLRRLGAWGKNWQNDFPDGAFVFPERAGGRVVGLAFRALDGRKGAAAGSAGSRRGLSIAHTQSTFENPVLIVEGPSDVAACLTLGLRAVGRPSNTTGARDLAEHLSGQSPIVVGENDAKPDGTWPGRTGAMKVASELAALMRCPVRVAFPPKGCKDIREWLNQRSGQGLDIVDAEETGRAGDGLLAHLVAGASPIDAGGPDDGHPRPQWMTVRQLMAAYTQLRPPIIHGLLRSGETLNIIAAPKTGKSWLGTDLAIAVATGQDWLGVFETEATEVLILDNELHPETSRFRIPLVAAAREVELDEFQDRLTVVNLRGCLVDIYQLESVLADVEPGRYGLIILDALYRFLPEGCDENDNGAMARVYNLLDQLAKKLGCAIVCIHHTSKGNQAGKSVTDVGAGAGAQSRAVDAHVVLRDHEEAAHVVMDAAGRSWAPLQPIVLRFEFPIWKPAEGLDPGALRAERRTRARKEQAEPKPPPEPWTPERFVRAYLTPSPVSRDEITLKATGSVSKSVAKSLLDVACERGLAHRWQAGPSDKHRFATAPQPITYAKEKA